jgi:hypothetical protein
MVASLADALAYLQSNKLLGKDYRKALEAAETGDFGKDIDKAVKEAQKAASLSGDTLSGVGSAVEKSAEDGFWKRLGVGSGKAGRFTTDKFQETLKELEMQKRMQSRHPNLPGVDEKIAKLTEKLEKQAKELFPHVPEIERVHGEALAKLQEQKTRALAAKEAALEHWFEAEKGKIQSKVVAGASGTAYDGVVVKKGKLDFSGTTDAKAAEAAYEAAHDAEKKALKTTFKTQSEALEKEIAKKYKPLIKEHEKVLKTTKAMTEGAEQITGLKATEHMTATAKSTAAKLGNTAVMAEKGIVGAAAYEGMSGIGKTKAAISANWKQAGTMSKFARVAGTGAGVIIGGYGLKDLGQAVGVVAPDTDEQGKEIPADSGKLFKAVAELGAAAGLMYLSLVKGGKAAAIGGRA